MSCLVLMQLEAGQYCTFIIHTDGTASACGKGSYGRLGLGNSNNQPIPRRLQFDSRFVMIKILTASTACYKPYDNTYVYLFFFL